MSGPLRLSHPVLLAVLVLACIALIGAAPGSRADEVRLDGLACDVDADISADRVVWGAHGYGYWPSYAVRSKTFDLLTGFVTEDTSVYSTYDDAVIFSRISGDKLASWGYQTASLEAATLQVYDYSTTSPIVDLDVAARSADIEGDVVVWSGIWEGAASECEDFVLDRAGMAYLIACGLAGGEESVPEGPPIATFNDVPVDHWAYKYVEFVVANGVVQGYDPVTYAPTVIVSRDAMAVFVSRAEAGGDEYVPDGPPTATFEDVPTDHWAYKYVEYLNTLVTDAACSASPPQFCPGDMMYAFLGASWVEQALGTSVDPCRILTAPYDTAVYGLNTIAGMQVQITDDTALPDYPTVSYPWVVWQDRRDGHWDLYLADVTDVLGPVPPVTPQVETIHPSEFPCDELNWMPANVAGTLENMYSSDDSYMIVTKDEPYMSCQGSDGFEFTELPDHITRLTLSLEYRAEIDCCNSGEIVLYDNDGWWLGTIWSGILPTTDTVFAWSTEEPYSYVQPDATFWAQVCAPGAMARYYDVAELECEYLEPPPPVPNIRITDDPGDQMMPAISGQTLVWQDNRNGDWDIYLYEIPATPGITPGVRLTDDPADQMMPSISGDLVVYQDNRNGDWDIYLLELSSMIETRLTDDPANQTKPRIDGRRVVYLDDREGCAVYLLDLDAAPPLVDFAASPLEGDRPLLVEFTDLSTDDQLWWWDWDFGDGTTSASEHWPRFARDVHHIYDDPLGGVYDVTLTVTGIGGSTTLTKADLITVWDPGHAYVTVRHEDYSQLDIEIGCGDPDAPLWLYTIWSHGWSFYEVLELSVDLSSAAPLLPPSSGIPWWVRVSDTSPYESGEILAFNIHSRGEWYGSTEMPKYIPDGFGSALVILTAATPPQRTARLSSACIDGLWYPPAPGTVGPEAGPYDISEYFPLDQADTWYYEEFATTGQGYSEYPCFVWGTGEFGGATAAARHVPGSAEYYTGTAEGITAYAMASVEWMYGDPVPYELWEFDPPVTVPNGLSVGDFGSATTDVYIDGMYSGTALHSYRLASVEDALVPAGLFQNCLRLERKLDLGDIVGWTEPPLYASTAWLAHGVGPVKAESREIRAPEPDLVIGALEAPVRAAAGVPFDVTVSTANFGCAPAPATTTGIFVSEDEVIELTDTLLAAVPVPALAGGDQDEQVVSVTIPSVGSYYIGAIADGTRIVAEADESNNTRATPLPSDLVQTWFEDDDLAIIYYGPWREYSHAAASAGHVRYCDEPSARAYFSFVGTGLWWHFGKAPTAGKAKVYLDGSYVGMVDLYSPSLGLQTLGRTGMPLGSHTVVLEVSGQKNPSSTGYLIDIDAFEVVP